MRDMEAATYCTLFLPKDSDIVKEMLSIGRHYSNMLENHPEQERGSRHIWFFNSMVKATETAQRSRIGERSSADQEQTEALRWLRTTTESTDLQELATWKKACRHRPTCAKPGKPDREWIIFAVEGLITYEWPKQDTDSAQPPFMPLEEPCKRKKGKRGGSESKIWSGTRWSCAERKPQQEEHRVGTWQGSSATRSCQTEASERAERKERGCSN